MKIGLLGIGVVGSGVKEQLSQRKDMQLKYILTRRNRPELGALQTESFETILHDSEVDTVVEVMGGMEPAHDYVLRALNAGKNVVTANKWMLSYHLRELLEAARAHGASLRFSASVGGGIPYLFSVIRLRQTDSIHAISGIVNGTTNLILDTMQSENVDFAQVLAQAQQEGYAEADPSADIDGIDARSKLCLSAALAFGKYVSPDAVHTEGIRRITASDVAEFKKMNLVCRLIASAALSDDGKIAAYVEPTLVSPCDLEASVRRNNNLITLVGQYVGTQSFFGQGAGKHPTAANVMLDLNDIQANAYPITADLISGTAQIDNSACKHRYYVRTKAHLDVPAEKTGENIYRTEPISVADMHSLAASLRKSDSDCFFAGIREANC